MRWRDILWPWGTLREARERAQRRAKDPHNPDRPRQGCGVRPISPRPVPFCAREQFPTHPDFGERINLVPEIEVIRRDQEIASLRAELDRLKRRDSCARGGDR